MHEHGSGGARGSYGDRMHPGHGNVEAREAAVRPLYGTGGAAATPDYGALTRAALDDLHGVVAELDRQRGEIRRLRGDTREILTALAA